MATKSNAVEAEVQGSAGGLKPAYLEAVSRVERLHRRLLDLIKDEFDRMGWDDINPVQALLMFNIGDAEMTAGELRSRGYYLGSNVSYNLKKLVETGYIFQERSRADRRSVRIRLTPKGEEVAEVIDELYDRHLKSIDKVGGLTGWSGSGSTRSSTSSRRAAERRYPLRIVASGPQPRTNAGLSAGVSYLRRKFR
jgi:DNA-binding MarR family transcriptional regulator